MKNISILTTCSAILFSIFFVAKESKATTIIDTTPFWNGTAIVEQFGENLPNLTSAFGQTFTVPKNDNVLTNFTLYAAKASGQVDDVDFIFYVMEWDATSIKPVGYVLFKSPIQTIDRKPLELDSFTFTPQIALTPGLQYVAFVTDVELLDEIRSAGRLGFIHPPTFDAYSEGNFVIGNFLEGFSDVTTKTWTNTFFPESDLAFTANFASSKSVPESSSIFGLLTLGVVSISSLRKSKK